MFLQEKEELFSGRKGLAANPGKWSCAKGKNDASGAPGNGAQVVLFFPSKSRADGKTDSNTSPMQQHIFSTKKAIKLDAIISHIFPMCAKTKRQVHFAKSRLKWKLQNDTISPKRRTFSRGRRQYRQTYESQLLASEKKSSFHEKPYFATFAGDRERGFLKKRGVWKDGKVKVSGRISADGTKSVSSPEGVVGRITESTESKTGVF